MEHSFRGVLVTLIGLLTSVGAGHLTAQDIPALEPANYTVYDTENGLPDNCVLSVIGDQYGRIWGNSCNPKVTGTQGSHQFLGINPKEIRPNCTETCCRSVGG